MDRASGWAASVAVSFILLVCSGCGLAQSVDTRVCEETKGGASLPMQVNQSYHASMLTKINGQTLGHASIVADFSTGRSAITFVSPSEEFRAIFNTDTGQTLVVNQLLGEFEIDNCQVQNSSGAGFAPQVQLVNFLGMQRVLPTGNIFNATGLKVDAAGPDYVNGIAADRFSACYYASHLQGTLGISWLFSPDASRKVLQVKIAYRKANDPNPAVNIEYTLSYLRYSSGKHDATRHPLAAPKGVYCKGLVSVKRAPPTFDRFSVGVTRYIYNLPGPQPNAGPDSFRESYDQRANVSMIEGEGIGNTLDKAKYGGGRLARINDFTRGISYVKNLRYENCTFERIPENDWDTDPSPNGAKIKSPDEFFFPSLNELQFKGSGVYRTADVDIYIGYKDNFVDIGDGKKYPLSIEYYLDIRTSYDGTGQPVFKTVPLAAYSASPNKLNSFTEVFDFNSGVPRAYDHDISDCFGSTEVMHFELILTTADLDQSYEKFIDDYRSEFTYALVNSLSKAINVSPLRIIQPKVSLFADQILLVEITVADRVTIRGYLPPLQELPLSQVPAAMSGLIAKSSLSVDVTEGDLEFSVPIVEFVPLDSRGSAPSPGGLSTGAVVGLCIGMILLGIVLGLAVVFAVGYFRRDASIFGFKSFTGTQEA